MTHNLADPYTEQAEGLINAIKALLDSGVDDTLCYRALIDNFCAYQMDARNGKDKLGRWDTKKIRNSKKCYWSKEAWATELKWRKEKPKGETKDLHREHVIPMNVIVKILLEKAQTETGIEAQKIKETLDAFAIFAIVTKDQHSDLNAKYKSKMPDGWKTENPIFARYIESFKIEFNDRFEGNSFFEPAPYED